MSDDDMCYVAADHSQMQVIDDLAMLVRRLANSINKTTGNTLLARQAFDYLKRNHLEGALMRVDNSAE